MQTQLHFQNSEEKTELISLATAERIAAWLAIAVAVFAIFELALS